MLMFTLLSACLTHLVNAQTFNLLPFLDVPASGSFESLPFAHQCTELANGVPEEVREATTKEPFELFPLRCDNGIAMPRGSIKDTFDLIVLKDDNVYLPIILSYFKQVRQSSFGQENTDTSERSVSNLSYLGQGVFSYLATTHTTTSIINPPEGEDSATHTYIQSLAIRAVRKSGLLAFDIPLSDYSWQNDEVPETLAPQLTVNLDFPSIYVSSTNVEPTSNQVAWVGTHNVLPELLPIHAHRTYKSASYQEELRTLTSCRTFNLGDSSMTSRWADYLDHLPARFTASLCANNDSSYHDGELEWLRKGSTTTLNIETVHSFYELPTENQSTTSYTKEGCQFNMVTHTSVTRWYAPENGFFMFEELSEVRYPQEDLISSECWRLASKFEKNLVMLYLEEDGVKIYEVPLANYTWDKEDTTPHLTDQLSIDIAGSVITIESSAFSLNAEQHSWLDSFDLSGSIMD